MYKANYDEAFANCELFLMDAHNYLTIIKSGDTYIEPGFADTNNSIAFFPVKGTTDKVETSGLVNKTSMEC